MTPRSFRSGASTPTAPSPIAWPWTAAISCALVAFSLRSAHEPLWLDETYSFAIVQHGFTDLIRFTAADVHPPLYYLLLKLSTLVLGDSPLALRFPSVLAATGIVALGAGPIRRVWDDRTALVFVFLVLSSSGLLSFAQEARMYSLATLLVTAAVLYGHLALRDGRRSDFVVFGVCTWAASLTHYFALVAVGMNVLVLLVAAVRAQRQRLGPLATAAGFAFLGFLPWAPSFWGQLLNVTKDFWIPPTSLNLVAFGLVAPFAYKYEDIAYPWQAVVALGGTVVIVVLTQLARRLRATAAMASAQLQCVLVFALTLGFGLAFSALVRPIFMPRYMIVCSGLVLAALAAGIGRLPKLGSIATTALFVLLGLPAWLRVQIETFNGPFADLALEVEKSGEPMPMLVHNGVPFSFALVPTAHAVPESRNFVLAPSGNAFDPTAGGLYTHQRLEVIESLDALLKSAERVWIVDGSPGPDPIDVAPIAMNPNWTNQGAELKLEQPMSWVKLTVRRYERRRPESPQPGAEK